MVYEKLTIDSAKGHTSASTNKSREVGTVSSDELAALSRVILLLVEVKDKVIVLGEKSKAVSGTGDMLVMCPSQVIIGGCLRIS